MVATVRGMVVTARRTVETDRGMVEDQAIRAGGPVIARAPTDPGMIDLGLTVLALTGLGLIVLGLTDLGMIGLVIRMAGLALPVHLARRLMETYRSQVTVNRCRGVA